MKQLCFFLACLASFISCKDAKTKGAFELQKVSTEATGEIRGEVILPAAGIRNYYDVAITDDYFAFMDYDSDTLLQVVRKSDLSLTRIGLRERDTFRISYPSFAKYDFKNKGKKNAITIWENELSRLNRIDLDSNPSGSIVTPDTIPLISVSQSAECTNSCITQHDTYSVAFNPGKPSVFFSWNPSNGQYRVPPYPEIDVPMPNDVRNRAFASDLVVNEEKGVIVAALRFINSVQFYNLNCDRTQAVSFGDYYIVPIADITGEHLDGERSTKCFIDVCSSDQYVYCLYDGSTDFTNNSLIYIFDWNGKHQDTLQTDRSLRKIATDKSGKYILGLAANLEGGRDVVKYTL